MDFHSLARRDLQTLCKKNKIPANLTNVAMADALKALKSIEWDEEIKQKLMPQSEIIEQNRSPLPGSRRVAAGFSMEDTNDKEEEMKKEALLEPNQTPATAVRRSSRLQSAMATRTRARTSATAAGTGTNTAGTRTRKGKKEEESPAEPVDSVAVETPALRRGRKKAVETPAEVVAPRSSARPIRQSTRKLAESTSRARTTRTMAKIMTLDPDNGNEAHTVVEELKSEKEQTEVQKENTADTTPEQAQEAKADITELGEATEPHSAEKLELTENVADQNQVNEISEETEQAKQTEDVDQEKEDELPSDENLNLVEHITTEIESAEENIEEGITESTEENIEEGFDINPMTISKEDDIPQDKYNNEADGSEENTGEELKEMSAEKAKEALEEKLNSNASEEQGNELEDENVSIEKSVEEVTEVGSDTNGALISEEEGQVAPGEQESEVNLTTLADSPILGLVSEVMRENNSELQNSAPSEPPTETCIISPVIASSDQVCLADSLAVEYVPEAVTENNSEPPRDVITLDALYDPSKLCFSSPVRAPTDQGVEKMLDSVVRRFARASINDSAKKIDACAGQNEEKDNKVVTDVSGLVQNENADKVTGDLNSMSLRKLKALYKNKLNEVNSAKVAEEGKRLPLGKLDENLLV